MSSQVWREWCRAESFFTLPLSTPLDLPATIDGGQVFRWTRHDDWWWGVLGDSAVRIRVAGAALEFASAPHPPEAMRDRLTRFLAVDWNPAPIHAALRQDPYLAAVLDRFPGLGILRQDPWECLVSFICSAQCNIPRIHRMTDALARAYGTPVAMDGRALWTFPTPEALARAGEEPLRRLGLGFRAKSVAAAAGRVADGAVDLVALRSTGYDDAREALLALHGVGPKIADCVLLFSLGHGQAFPLDRWVRRALLRVYGLNEKTPDRTLTAWARERFGPYAGYAQQLLFHAERVGGDYL